MRSYSVTTELKAVVVLFIMLFVMLYDVIQTLESVNDIIKCADSNTCL